MFILIDKFLEKLNIPASCEVNKTIFKKLFYENGSMNKQDKDIFASHINKITWLYSLKEDTINIQSYKDDENEYEEIAFIQAELNGELKFKRVSEIIQRTIPYPVILVFTYKNKILLNAVLKKINKADESKNTVGEFIFTDWVDFFNLSERETQFLDSLNIKGLSFDNFYKFYLDLVDRINLFNASKYQDDYESLMNKNVNEVNEISARIEELEKQILQFKNKIKKEAHFSRKVDMNINIKKLEMKKQSLINELKG